MDITLYAPHARSRGTGGRRRSAVAASVLDELAAMPLELIRAADALVIQSTLVLYQVSVVVPSRRSAPRAQSDLNVRETPGSTPHKSLGFSRRPGPRGSVSAPTRADSGVGRSHRMLSGRFCSGHGPEK
ncbi:hypothetical protein GCM10010271_68080 [Streptomyces kurssanovii]|nr:hypothetical protein GCM10010271_68080 [Streptomyces kurssanovii]